jgi:putative nucleotidyltransferase with HDIG domain
MWTARVARALVPFVTAEVARSAYLCALLHDIGRQLMAVVDPEAFDAVLDAERAGHPDAEAVEREAFGIDHAALGAACLRLWSFPPELAAAVAHHHQPIALRRDGVEAARVAVLQLADTVAHAIEATDRVEGVLAYAAHDPARRVLGVRREQLEAIAGELLLERDELGRLAA